MPYLKLIFNIISCCLTRVLLQKNYKSKSEFIVLYYIKLRYDCEEKPGTAIAGCPPIATLYKCLNTSQHIFSTPVSSISSCCSAIRLERVFMGGGLGVAPLC